MTTIDHAKLKLLSTYGKDFTNAVIC